MIDVEARQKEIIKAIKKSLFDKGFISRAKKCKSPYGTGGASRKIVAVLESVKLAGTLLQKSITY